MTALHILRELALLVLHAVVAKHMWQWFVAELFDLPVLTYFQAFGLLLTTQYFGGSRTLMQEETEWDDFVTTVVFLLALFAVGFMAHWVGVAQ